MSAEEKWKKQATVTEEGICSGDLHLWGSKTGWMPKCYLKQSSRRAGCGAQRPRPGQHPGGVVGLFPRKRRERDKAVSLEGELKRSLRFLKCWGCIAARKEGRRESEARDTNTTWAGEERLKGRNNWRSRNKIRVLSKEARQDKIVGGEWCQSSGQTEEDEAEALIEKFD